MRQYSTPTLKFHLTGDELNEVLAGTGVLTFGKIDDTTKKFTQVFDATYWVENENGQTYIYTTLTQEQTAKFDGDTNAYVQFRSKNGETAFVSSITPVKVLPTIKNEVL